VEHFPPQQPSEQGPEIPIDGPFAEVRIPANPNPAAPRELTPEDFAFLARLPTRKPEFFDRDAITRAAWLVLALALGLWFITLFAKPDAPAEPEPEPSTFVQEAPPIVLPGNETAPALEPEPLAPVQAPAMQAPAMQAPRFQAPVSQRRAETAETYPAAGPEAMPAADSPDPSNLFPAE